jgi:hypothetical protein
VISFKLLPLYSKERAPGTRFINDWFSPEPVWTLCRTETILSMPGIEQQFLDRPSS